MLAVFGEVVRVGSRATHRCVAAFYAAWRGAVAAVIGRGCTRNQRTGKSPGCAGRPWSDGSVAAGGVVFRRTCGIASSRVGAFEFATLPGRNGVAAGRFPRMVATCVVGRGGSRRRLRRSTGSGLPG